MANARTGLDFLPRMTACKPGASGLPRGFAYLPGHGQAANDTRPACPAGGYLSGSGHQGADSPHPY